VVWLGDERRERRKERGHAESAVEQWCRRVMRVKCPSDCAGSKG
jgi:hypothetical protein